MRKELPQEGAGWPELEARMNELCAGDRDWRHGKVPLYVFRATDEAYDVGFQAFMQYFSENALGGKRAFFGIGRMEREVVEMALSLFHGPEGAGGAMTSGGSESLLVAVKCARDHARAKGRKGPYNIVLPFSAHPGFDKAADLMDLEVRRVGLGADMRADPAAIAAAMDGGTMLIGGSVPCFPHGVIDPIAALGSLALEHDTWLHVDACVGGYLAPFVRAIGRPIPDFDFAVPGVRSISADLHKFGFCPKPASTVLLREAADMERAVMGTNAWPHGLFATPTVSGTRPGGAIAGAWAVLHNLGHAGYCAIAERLMTMTDGYRAGIEATPGLKLIGAPDLTILNFGSDTLDMPALAAAMDERGFLPGQTRTPPGLHLMLSLLHEPAREDYLAALADAVRATAGTSTTAATSTYA